MDPAYWNQVRSGKLNPGWIQHIESRLDPAYWIRLDPAYLTQVGSSILNPGWIRHIESGWIRYFEPRLGPAYWNQIEIIYCLQVNKSCPPPWDLIIIIILQGLEDGSLFTSCLGGVGCISLRLGSFKLLISSCQFRPDTVDERIRDESLLIVLLEQG